MPFFTSTTEENELNSVYVHFEPTPTVHHLMRTRIETALMSDSPVEALEALQVAGKLPPAVQATVGFGGLDEGHKDLWDHIKKVVSQTVPRPLVRWAALYHDVGKVAVFSRASGKVTFHGHESVSAKLFNREAHSIGFEHEDRLYIRSLIHDLGHIESYESSWTDSAVRRVHKLVGDHFTDLIDLARADITTKHDDKRQRHHRRVAELKARAEALAAADAIVPALPKGLGDVICKELGLTPGRELGVLMGRLKVAVEAGELPRQAEPSVYVAWAKLV